HRVDEGHIAAEHEDELVPGGRPDPRRPAHVRGDLSRSAADDVGDPEFSGEGSRASTEGDPLTVGGPCGAGDVLAGGGRKRLSIDDRARLSAIRVPGPDGSPRKEDL